MSSIVCLLSVEVVFLKLKGKFPVFHFLDLDCRILNLIYLKISRKCQNVH